MAYLIVQLGYTVFGASALSYESAIKEASQWASDPETGMQGTTEEKLEEILTPSHEACDGDLVMIETYDDLPENASSMDGDELYELMEEMS